MSRHHLHNDKGAALTVVLLTIVVLGVFSTLLASHITSTAKQAQKSEKHVQAESLAVMGKDWLAADIHTQLEANILPGNMDFQTYERLIEEGYYFTVEVTEVAEQNSGKWLLTYKSTGVADEVEEELTGEFTLREENDSASWVTSINKKKAEEEADLNHYTTITRCKESEGTYTSHVHFSNGVCLKGNQGPNFFVDIQDGNVWIEGGLELNGNRSFRVSGEFTYIKGKILTNSEAGDIVLNSDVYIEDYFFHVHRKSSLTIVGDAYFAHPSWEHAQYENICVTGQTNIPQFKKNKCH